MRAWGGFEVNVALWKITFARRCTRLSRRRRYTRFAPQGLHNIFLRRRRYTRFAPQRLHNISYAEGVAQHSPGSRERTLGTAISQVRLPRRGCTEPIPPPCATPSG